MNNFSITGILHKKFDTVQVSDRFKKREFVLLIEGEYPQKPSFQLTQDRVNQVDDKNPGQEITVSFRLSGRSWDNPEGETKYFTNLEAWKVEAGASILTDELPL